MASQKISQFTAITTLASGDYFPVVEASGTLNKRVEVGVLDARFTLAASGVAAQSTANEALASGNSALTSAATAQASGNAALVVGSTAQASGNAALVVADTAQASGNAALSSLSNKYDKTGGSISGPIVVQSQSFGETGAINSSGVCIFNFGTRNNFEVVLTNNSTFASPINASGGQCGAITIRQDGTGSRLVTYSGSWSFAGNIAPSLSLSASGVDILTYYVVNPNRVSAILSANYGSGTVS